MTLYENLFVSTCTGPSIWCQSAWLISHQRTTPCGVYKTEIDHGDCRSRQPNKQIHHCVWLLSVWIICRHSQMACVCPYLRGLLAPSIYLRTWVPVPSNPSRWPSTLPSTLPMTWSRFWRSSIHRITALSTTTVGILNFQSLFPFLSTIIFVDYLLSDEVRPCDGPLHKGSDMLIQYEQLKKEIQILETKLNGKPRLPSPPPPSKPLQEHVSLDLVYPRELCGLPPLPTHMVTLNPTTSVNLGLAYVDSTSPAWPEANFGSPQYPGSAHRAFHDASHKLSALQSSHRSLCAPNLKASPRVTNNIERRSTNSCSSPDMDDSTEGDLDDGDYVEPTNRKVGRRRKTSTSGVRGEFPSVLEIIFVIDETP